MSARRAQVPNPVSRGRTTVRRTVDLPLASHRGFEQWRHDTAESLGLTRVTGQEVLAALVDALLADERLSRKIAKTIAGKGER